MDTRPINDRLEAAARTTMRAPTLTCKEEVALWRRLTDAREAAVTPTEEDNSK
jgi:hypothetical protein